MVAPCEIGIMALISLGKLFLSVFIAVLYCTKISSENQKNPQPQTPPCPKKPPHHQPQKLQTKTKTYQTNPPNSYIMSTMTNVFI